MAVSLEPATEYSWRALSPSDARRRIAHALIPCSSEPITLGEITLRPHQVSALRAIQQALSHLGGALLADDVGMGKTFTALAASRDAVRLLVLAPATLREMWRHAGQRAARSFEFVSYEQLSRGHKPRETPDFVILDEAHHLRNPRTRRHDAVVHLTVNARVLLLTATPLHNRERDVRHLLSLFLGARAHHVPDDVLRRCTVRHTAADLGVAERLPATEPIHWLTLPHGEALLSTLTRIPAPVPPSDGGAADALLGLLLLRLWMSSTAALRHAMRRMWMRAAALADALQEGRYPNRAELGSWQLYPEALQLAFAPLVVATAASPSGTSVLLERLDAHMTGLQLALDALTTGPDVDAARAAHLGALIEREREGGVVAFTQYTETARMLFRRLPSQRGVMLLTAKGGVTGAGRLSRDDVLAAAHPAAANRPDPRLPVHALISTDLLSEGVNLGRFRELLHVDLPWTPARVHQRVGRLRRPESLHSSIGVSAFELPVSAEELVGIIRTLQRKAAAAQRLVGAGDMLHGVPWSGTHPADGSGQFDLTANMQRHLAKWRGHPDEALEEHVLPAACVLHQPDISHWIALLLVTGPQPPRLLVATPTLVGEDPEEIVRWLHHFECNAAGDPSCLAEVAKRFSDWRSREQARAAVSAVEVGDSPTHRAALRLLADLEVSLRRNVRLRAAGRLTILRRWVQQARGAGAERALANALAEARTHPTGLARLERLEALWAGGRPDLVEPDETPHLELALVVTPQPLPA